MKGLVNHGNTCYFNTSVQCLLNIPVFSNHFIRNPYKGNCTFTRIYSEFVHLYWTKGHETLDSKPLLRAFQEKFPRFRDREQHDVQETIMCMLDIIERVVPEIKPHFYGKKVQETIWPGGKSSNEEDFSIHLITSNGNDMGSMLSESTDWNILENFEDTSGKVHNVTTTRMIFSQLPKILMISFDQKSHIKIINNIEIDGRTYNLIASAVHMGIQSDGHYVCFIKRRDKWFLLNDESVEEHELPMEAGHYFMVYYLNTCNH